MTLLPTGAAFQAEPMSAAALSDLLVQLRDCLAGLVGTDGTPATALATLGALGGQVQALSGASTLTAAARGRMLLATGTWTLGLPAVASAGAGWSAIVANTGTGSITLDGSGAETVDGAATVALAAGRAAILICTGSAWVTLVLPGTAGGPLLAPAGTVAAPGLSPPGDSNTGISFPAADQIAASTGGVQRWLLSTTAFQLDVPLTGTAVTQSATDTTAGRVMKTGDWGLGSDAAPALPSNDFTAELREGFWRATEAGSIGHPTTSAYNLAVLALRMGGSEAGGVGGHAFMTMRGAGATPSNQRLRLGTRPTFTGALSWVEVLHNGRIVGTVSQTGGVPDGPVLQGNASSSSPAGGYVERLADGFQRLHAVVTSSSAGNTTVTFTNAFLTGSVPAVNITPEGDADYRPRIVSVSATALVFSVRDSAGNRVAVPAHIQVSGRWSNMT